MVREGFSEYPYLFILMKLWTGYCNNQLERMNINVDEENGKAMGMVKVRDREFWKFSSN